MKMEWNKSYYYCKYIYIEAQSQLHDTAAAVEGFFQSTANIAIW